MITVKKNKNGWYHARMTPGIYVWIGDSGHDFPLYTGEWSTGVHSMMDILLRAKNDDRGKET